MIVIEVVAIVTAKQESREHLVWGWFRLVLGFAQISLAGLTIGVLITVGVTKLTLLLAVSATAVTAVSRLIYHGRRRPMAQ